ncbi:MAG: hypothetical protein RJA44_1744 [Pseudomonadota bacterium]
MSSQRSGLLVVVGPGAAEPVEPPEQRRQAERRGLDRRVHDEAVRSAFETSHLLCAAQVLLYGLGLVHLAALPHQSAPLVPTWVGLGALGWSLWIVVLLLFRYGYARQSDTRRWRRLLVGTVLLNLVLDLAFVWLPPADDHTRLLGLIGTMGICSLIIGALPMLPGLATHASLLLMAGTGLLYSAPQQQHSPLLLACAVLSAFGARLAHTRHKQWFETARNLMEQQDAITQLHQALDRARHAEQDKSRFIATASHDLRQPMHALGLFVATLQQRLRDTPEAGLVRNMMRSVESLDRSFTAVLDISRIDAGALEPHLQRVSLNELFRRLHLHYAGQAEAAGLGLRLSPGGKQVWSDPQLLERILGNLIQNAIKYSHRGGVVVVARSTRTHINLEVWDSGVGIPADELPHVFDEFYQVGAHRRDRPGGLGMGLAIVKRLVRLLDHRLAAASVAGRGTMFRIGIAHKLFDSSDSVLPTDTQPAPLFQPGTVLVVDDEEPIREGLRLLLEEWGFEACVAADLGQARRIALQRHGAIDLLLCDLHLRHSEDGLQVIESVRQICQRQVPALVITGDTSPSEIRRANGSGNPVLFKPVQPRQLMAALHALAG